MKNQKIVELELGMLMAYMETNFPCQEMYGFGLKKKKILVYFSEN